MATGTKFFSHLNTAKQLIAGYNGQQPFPVFIKSFFKEHKKYGSSDRKSISLLCYSFFRIGNALRDKDTDTRILSGLFLCTSGKSELLEFFKPAWEHFLETNDFPPASERIPFIRDSGEDFHDTDIFSFSDELSAGVDKGDFILSHLLQPDLFIRIRPGFNNRILQNTGSLNIPAEFIPPHTIRLPNTFSVNTIGEIDKEIVIQDYSSQRTGEFIEGIKPALSHRTEPGAAVKVWDCCAASGGKSLLAYDLLGDIALTVSDVRASILQNLAKRFSHAGIKNYRSLIIDLSADDKKMSGAQTDSYDLIIIDAPCSGSGTWGRNPEQLSFFRAKQISNYADLQRKIAKNSLPFLKTGGYLLYITCSVFKKENEDAAFFIRDDGGLHLLNMQLIKGYNGKADTMFAALFTNTMS